MVTVETCPIVGGAPEDILVLPNGDVITGTIDGRLQKFRADFSAADTLVQMDVRALGVDMMLDGRVVFCDSGGGKLEKLMGGLLFANGVVVAPDQKSVLIAETGTATIHRVWVDGPKSGISEVFASDMLGMPDNLALADDGSLLVAWPSPFDNRVQRIIGLPRIVRKLILMLPNFMKPKAADRFMFARYDFEGNELGFVDCEAAGYHFVTGGRQVGDWIYVGSVEENAVARFPIAELEG